MTSPRLRMAVLGALLAGSLGGFLVAVGIGARAAKSPPTDPAVAVQAPPIAPLPAETRVSPLRRTPVVEAVEKVAPAVVAVTTEVPVTDPFLSFYGRSTSKAEGSGVVIDSEGIVLTNAHVVQRASRIETTFADGRSFEADIIGIAAELDLAVLRLREPPPNLTAVPPGPSADLLLGEPVIAIGNPFGLGHTVTTGVVSAVHRALETEDRVYQDFIQTDASINPGNSGGPLIDIEGRLIGINTAIRPDAEGIGFAIPSDRAIKVARDLMMFGNVQVPWLGFDVVDVAVSDLGRRRTAIQIQTVYPEGGAEEAGVEPGDLVLSIDGRAVSGRADMNAYLSSFDPGGRVKLETARGATRSTVEVTTRKLAPTVVARSLGQVLGVRIGDAPPDPKKRITGGAVVTEVIPGGAFARAGLRVGDIIVAINGRPVAAAGDVEKALESAKSGHWPSALLTIRRGSAKGQINLAI